MPHASESHINGSKKWTKGVFREARIEGKLILALADGTERVMNYKGWGRDAHITAQKVLALEPGTPIEFATWDGRDPNNPFDPDEWFCDVR